MGAYLDKTVQLVTEDAIKSQQISTRPEYWLLPAFISEPFKLSH